MGKTWLYRCLINPVPEHPKRVNMLKGTKHCLNLHESICRNQFKCSYVENKKVLLNFLLYFWNLHQILNILKQKMTLIVYVFPKLQTAKDLVRPMSKKRRFRTPFDSQYVKRSQTLLKSGWQHFCQIFSSLWGNLTWKMSFLVIYEVLGHFVNTLTADE